MISTYVLILLRKFQLAGCFRSNKIKELQDELELFSAAKHSMANIVRQHVRAAQEVASSDGIASATLA
jgi:uncharacterized lipoprotein YajG